VKEKRASELIENVCCPVKSEQCLFRNCVNCADKRVTFFPYSEDIFQYKKWDTVVEQKVNSKSNDDQVVKSKVTKKNEASDKTSDFLDGFHNVMTQHMAHLGRVEHQKEASKEIQENISPEDLLVMADWSENYQCKCAEEVQSVHFGGSRSEVSLHTGIAIRKENRETFCTISSHKEHGPISIFAHLKPTLERSVLEDTKNISSFHE